MVRKLVLAVVVVSTYLLTPVGYIYNTHAISCPDMKIIFARGSGQERWIGQDFINFKDELTEKLKLTSLKYDFLDLDYPAIGVADILVLFSTFVSGGEAYGFGESVDLGVKKLISEVSSCSATKFIIAGYSQGAMVVSKAIQIINPEKIIYAATFGDPKIYLPEGAGLIPSACNGKNLSNYRIYVPDCRVYEGLLGGYNPYQPDGYADKLGTWCNHTDIFCSTHFSVKSHTSYVADGLYADASKVIFDKITKAFGILNNHVSLHDTAILIDSTGSMDGLIEDYKTEALNLAEKTLASGGRVALFDYRDLDDPYEVTEHCNFENCTLESFKTGLDEIVVEGGGDVPESLLSSGFNMMKRLNWKHGSTKSVVVLTDADYHEPDLDGTTFADVVALSKSIDPVNFYIITPEETMDFYNDLANATGGAVVNSASDLSLLTNEIMTRYDSLPRVEEDFTDTPLPEISEVLVDGNCVSFKNTGTRALVILNDAILGITEKNSITISDLDFDSKNTLRLVPLAENMRGRGVEVELGDYGRGELNLDIIIPKVPNAGKQ